MKGLPTSGLCVNALTLSFIVSILLIGCSEKRDPSLVGDWFAPRTELLTKETIEIGRKVGPVGNGVRSVIYTIRPGGNVHFEQKLDNGTPMSPATFEKTEARAEFRLSDRQYQEVLERLALLHPRRLPGAVQPKGCRHVYDAGFKAGAFFFLNSTKIGTFQFQRTCTGSNAVAVEKLLDDLFGRLERKRAMAMSASNK